MTAYMHKYVDTYIDETDMKTLNKRMSSDHVKGIVQLFLEICILATS